MCLRWSSVWFAAWEWGVCAFRAFELSMGVACCANRQVAHCRAHRTRPTCHKLVDTQQPESNNANTQCLVPVLLFVPWA